MKMEAILNKIRDISDVCRNLAAKGFDSAGKLPWLKVLHTSFKVFHDEVAECLLSEEINKQMIFLCLSQVFTCIRNLEKILTMEEKFGIVLSKNRQHFIDRILWCNKKLKSSFTIKSVKKNRFDNFLDNLEQILELIDQAKLSEWLNTEDIKNMKSLVEIILRRVLTVANVSSEEDKKVLLSLSKDMILNFVDFEKEFSKDIDFDLDGGKYEQAVTFENSVLGMESYLKKSLMRLTYDTFTSYRVYSLDRIKKFIDFDVEEESLDRMFAQFKANIVKTKQIGYLAIAATKNARLQTKIRSSIASLEALDFLVPSLQSKDAVFNSHIFCDHLEDELKSFKATVHKAIDGAAFVKGYLDALDTFINQFSDSTRPFEFEDLMVKGYILSDHFKVDQHFECSDQKIVQRYSKTLRECGDLVECFRSVDSCTILKNLHSLKTVLEEMDCKTSTIEEDEFPQKSQEVSCEFFETFGIEPSNRNMLYSRKGVQKRTKDSNKNRLDGRIFKKPNRSGILTNTMLTSLFKEKLRANGNQMYKDIKSLAVTLDIDDII